MLTLISFLEGVDKNVARINEYKLGCDGSNGKCDCIGLIIGACRLQGQSWTWTHGSNYTARYLIEDLVKDAPLKLGDLVFKGRQPGDKGYNLPSKYSSHPDQTDYYHVGVVTQLEPLRITHCTSVQGGIKIDTKLGAWRYSGTLNFIEREDVPVETAIVYAESGKTVNMRKAPKSTASVVMEVPIGATVVVFEKGDSWSQIQYRDKSGYMMTRFLKFEEEPQNNAEELIQQAIDLLNQALNQMK